MTIINSMGMSWTPCVSGHCGPRFASDPSHWEINAKNYRNVHAYTYHWNLIFNLAMNTCEAIGVCLPFVRGRGVGVGAKQNNSVKFSKGAAAALKVCS